MKYTTLLLVACLCLFSQAKAQSILLGPEYNFYPAGHILGIQVESPFKSTVHSWNARLAYNMSDRKDFSGLNDNEEGGGPGISVGYRYYPLKECSGIYLGLRADLWRMKINWTDSSELVPKGETRITVFQPTFELGYLFHIGENWDLGTAFVNGFEINLQTDGEEVGQGWITLWQLRLSRRLTLKK